MNHCDQCGAQLLTEKLAAVNHQWLCQDCHRAKPCEVCHRDSGWCKRKKMASDYYNQPTTEGRFLCLRCHAVVANR